MKKKAVINHLSGGNEGVNIGRERPFGPMMKESGTCGAQVREGQEKDRAPIEVPGHGKEREWEKEKDETAPKNPRRKSRTPQASIQKGAQREGGEIISGEDKKKNCRKRETASRKDRSFETERRGCGK